MIIMSFKDFASMFHKKEYNFWIGKDGLHIDLCDLDTGFTVEIIKFDFDELSVCGLVRLSDQYDLCLDLLIEEVFSWVCDHEISVYRSERYHS